MKATSRLLLSNWRAIRERGVSITFLQIFFFCRIELIFSIQTCFRVVNIAPYFFSLVSSSFSRKKHIKKLSLNGALLSGAFHLYITPGMNSVYSKCTCSICFIQAVTISSICSSVSLELAAAMKSLGELILVKSMLSHSLRVTASSKLACALASIPEYWSEEMF